MAFQHHNTQSKRKADGMGFSGMDGNLSLSSGMGGGLGTLLSKTLERLVAFEMIYVPVCTKTETDFVKKNCRHAASQPGTCSAAAPGLKIDTSAI